MTGGLLRFFLTVGYAGHFPFAPGTMGSLVGVLACRLARGFSPFTYIVTGGMLLVAGILAANRAEKIFGETDPGPVVLDEFVGVWIAMAWVPATAGFLAAGFLIFRLFDIWKPGPIGWCERRFAGGLGIMLDDVAAGLATNLILQMARHLA